KERETQPLQAFLDTLPAILDDMQKILFNRAQQFQRQHTQIIESKNDFYDFFSGETTGGFALAHWNGSPDIEEQLKKDLNVTIRCIPLGEDAEPGDCAFSREKSPQAVIFAKAY